MPLWETIYITVFRQDNHYCGLDRITVVWLPSHCEMFESIQNRFAVAVFLLIIYGTFERQWQLGVIISAPLSAILFWKCENPWLVVLLIVDCYLFYYSLSVYSYVPFLISQTLLLTTRFPTSIKVLTTIHQVQLQICLFKSLFTMSLM